MPRPTRAPYRRLRRALVATLALSGTALVAAPATASTPMTTIPVGSSPWGVAVDPGLHTVYVVNADDATVSVIDEDTNHVTDTIDLGAGSHPYEVAVDPATHRVYVSGYGAYDTVAVIDGTTDQVVDTITVGGSPLQMAVDSAAQRLYVVNQRDDSVSVVDTSTDQVTATVPVGSVPWSIAVDTASGQVFVGNLNSDTVSVVDTSTDTVTATLAVGGQPLAIGIDSILHRGYVAIGNGVLILDTSSSPTVTGTLSGARGDVRIAVDEGSHIASLLASSGLLTTVDETTDEVIDTAQLDEFPNGVGVDPTRGTVYVSNGDHNTVTDVDARTPQHLSFTTTAPTRPTAGSTYDVAVATDGSSTNPVTLSVDPSSAGGACTLSDRGDGTGTVTFTGGGACVVDADQAGDATDAPAQTAQQSITVVKVSQTVTFATTPPDGPVVGDTYDVAAAGGGSGNPVSFSVGSASSWGACRVTDHGDSTATVSFDGPGTCVVDADQAGNGAYEAATTARQTVSVAQASQTVAFTSLPPGKAVAGDTYDVAATGGGSGNPVSFSVDPTSDPGACLVADHGDSTGTVSFGNPGTCVVDADQAGNGGYTAAPRVQQSIDVVPTPAPTPPPRAHVVLHAGHYQVPAGRSVRVFGRDFPVHAGRAVLLQQRTPHGWVTIRRIAERRSGRFAAELTAAHHAVRTYRAEARHGGTLVVSPGITIRWR